MNDLPQIEKLSLLLGYSDSDDDLVRMRQELRDPTGGREGSSQDTPGSEQENPARAGDPSFQVSSPSE